MDKIKGKLFLISAPSGAGKTTLANLLVDSMVINRPIKRVVTYTTRDIRENEVEGVDYHFIAAKEFKLKIESGFFLEWSSDYGKFYGTSKNEILRDIDKGYILILVMDRKGVESVQAVCNESVSIWIMPPSLEVLKKRLMSRATESMQEINNRINIAKEELEKEKNESIFNYCVINDSLSLALSRLEQIVEYSLNN